MAISIGIPFYNAERFLPDAIRSVFAQTYEDWELILVNDGSTDHSLEIAQSVRDPRVRVISDGKNMRLAARLNQITQLARYDLIARMDADDLMSPTRIQKQVDFLENNPGVDLVTTGLFSVTDDLKPIYVRWNTKDNITHDELLERNIVVHAAIVARKRWYARNPYDASLKVAQDYDLWLKSSYNDDFKLRFLPEALYYYREVDNVSIKKIFIAGKNGREMLKKYGKVNMHKIFQAYARVVIASAVCLLGMNKLLLKRRGKPVTDRMLLERFSEEIRQIKATKVPGL